MSAVSGPITGLIIPSTCNETGVLVSFLNSELKSSLNWLNVCIARYGEYSLDSNTEFLKPVTSEPPPETITTGMFPVCC